MPDNDAAIINATTGEMVLAVGVLREVSPNVWSFVAVDPGYVPTSRTISTTAPLTGGGDLSINRTISMPVATAIVDGYMSAAFAAIVASATTVGKAILAATDAAAAKVALSLAKGDVGLGSVDNTSDATKNVLYAATAGSATPTAHASSHAASGSDPVVGPLSLNASALGAAGTAALKIASGPLLLTPEAGAIERLVDKYYATISTDIRKPFVLADASLTSGRIPFTTTDGRLLDSAVLLFDLATGNITHGASISTAKLGVGTAAPTFLGTKLNVGTSLGTMGSSAAIAHFVDNSVNATVNYQNTNVAGYTAFDLFNSAGTKVTTFAWSNASAGFLPGTLWFMTRTAADIVLGTNTTERVRIKSTGEVLIANLTPGQPVFATTAGQLISSPPYAAKTANYTLAATDRTIRADATGGSFALTLPTAVGCAGREYFLKCISGTNTLTINTTSSQTIDGVTSLTLAQWDCLHVQSDGANWMVL